MSNRVSDIRSAQTFEFLVYLYSNLRTASINDTKCNIPLKTVIMHYNKSYLFCNMCRFV